MLALNALYQLSEMEAEMARIYRRLGQHGQAEYALGRCLAYASVAAVIRGETSWEVVINNTKRQLMQLRCDEELARVMREKGKELSQEWTA